MTLSVEQISRGDGIRSCYGECNPALAQGERKSGCHLPRLREDGACGEFDESELAQLAPPSIFDGEGELFALLEGAKNADRGWVVGVKLDNLHVNKVAGSAGCASDICTFGEKTFLEISFDAAPDMA